MTKLNTKLEFAYFYIFRHILRKIHICAIFSIFRNISHVLQFFFCSYKSKIDRKNHNDGAMVVCRI